MNFADLQVILSSIGWSLIHFLWQGTIITLVYLVITRSINSIHTKYWTGMTLVIISLIVPLINNYKTVHANTSLTSAWLEPQTIFSYQQLSAGNLILYFIDQSLPYIASIWALIVIFLSIRLIKSWVNLASITHDCDPRDSSRLKQCVKNIAIQIDLHTIPILKVSREVMIPAAYGLLKPTILLPFSLINQIPQDQLEAIIKHELCHLKRNDFAHNIIQLFADILLFFHPGIRWMNNDIRHIREKCCDQMVLSHQTETLTYAKALTNIASLTNNITSTHSIQLGINDGMLLNRVKFLLQNKSSQSSLMIFIPFLTLLLFVVILFHPKSKEKHLTPENITRVSMQNETITPTPRPIKNTISMGDNNFYPVINKNQPIHYSEAQINPTRPHIPEPNTFIPTYKTRPLTKSDTITRNELLSITTTEKKAIEPKKVTNASSVMINPKEQELYALTDSKNNNQAKTIQELNSFTPLNSIMLKFKKYVSPEYPEYFWLNQIEQDVIASFKINSDGKPYDIIVKSQNNNYIAFEKEVIKAIKKWKLDSQTLNPSILKRTYQQIFSFTISEDLIKNCELARTGSRLRKPTPCNK